MPRSCLGWGLLGIELLSANLVACRDVHADALQAVDAVSGPSQLHRAGLPLGAPGIGMLGGTALPPSTGEPMPTREQPDPAFRLDGADLYRIGCQACHGPDARGAAPEVNDLMGPAQGTSAVLLTQRMRDLGQPVDDALLRELAASAIDAIRLQVRTGGPKMPSFEFMRADEVDAIIAHLQQLGGVPASEQLATRVQERAVRAGEVLVRGTCHTCHDATGPGAGHVMMMSRIIPSLASMPAQRSAEQLVAKVREGRGVMMPMMRMPGWAQMPLYPYLTPQEVTAAYFYLAAVPPTP
jgi:mono/diheme cytochrome c family protein